LERKQHGKQERKENTYRKRLEHWSPDEWRQEQAGKRQQEQALQRHFRAWNKACILDPERAWQWSQSGS
jgi:hypothetical protein